VYIVYTISDIPLSNPLFARVEITTLRTITKNWLFLPNISGNRPIGPIFTKFSNLIDLCVRMINLTFIFLSSKGRYHGINQLIFGTEKYTWLAPDSLYTQMFLNCVH